MPVPGFETIFVYDVTHQWREMTNRPSVLAFWACTEVIADSSVAADFARSKKYGLDRVREISEAASIKLDMPPGALERYLTDNINFDLDHENLAGLQLYYEKAAAHGLIPRPKPLKFLAAGASTETTRAARS
jgi:predicted solute-binding protein